MAVPAGENKGKEDEAVADDDDDDDDDEEEEEDELLARVFGPEIEVGADTETDLVDRTSLEPPKQTSCPKEEKRAPDDTGQGTL